VLYKVVEQAGRIIVVDVRQTDQSTYA